MTHNHLKSTTDSENLIYYSKYSMYILYLFIMPHNHLKSAIDSENLINLFDNPI